MSVPESVRLKLGMAKKHLDTLQKLHDEFLATNPYEARRILKDPTVDGKSAQHVVLWERFAFPPDDIGSVLGDLIHNLRSALDHLAFALAQHGAQAKGMTMTPEQEARIQFPIVLSHNEFIDQVKRGRLKFVEPEARARIEARQPYNISTFPKRGFPTVINRLDNTDKHRTINVVVHSTVLYQDSWSAEVRDTQLKPPASGFRYEPGAEIGTYNFPTPQSEMDVPLNFAFGLIIRDGWPRTHGVCDLMRTYIDSTERMTINWIAELLP